MAQSPELAGGAGFTFEDEVVAATLAALLAEAEVPGLVGRSVCRVAVQQRDAGEPLDDLVVDGRAADGEIARLGLQVKRSLTISAAATNADFRAVVRDCWLTLDKKQFREGVDRYGAATQEIAAEKARDFRTLCGLARASATVADFEARFAPGGNASKQAALVLEDVRSITRDLGRPDDWPSMRRFLAHMVLVTFDFLHEGAGSPAAVGTTLRGALREEAADFAPSLHDRLRTVARQGAGRSTVWDRVALLSEVAPHAPLRGARSLARDLERLTAESAAACGDIEDGIGGVRLRRERLVAFVDETLRARRFVQIHGLPGSGKSVVLRRHVETALGAGPVLLLKADRLEGTSWAAHAGRIGVECRDCLALLAEIGAVGTATLFIDGLDRIDRGQRGIVNDLIRTILTSAALSEWQVLATLRDGGMEPLRTWLPAELFAGKSIGMVPVGSLDEGEAEQLAEGNPMLRPLLFGAREVRDVVRRPFFAKVLASAGTGAGPVPGSEIVLAELWWDRGGFDAEGPDATTRQRALVALAAAKAPRTEAPIHLAALGDHDGAISQLVEDGVLQVVRKGHSVRFAHDIFFEWAFLHLLVDAGHDWPAIVGAAGEPPGIGRSVELLSQVAYASANEWRKGLDGLRAAALRPQWKRAWLLAPLSLPRFGASAEQFEAATAADGYGLLRSALVWFQAERTRPNPLVLDGTLIATEMDRDTRLRAADLLGWPSDVRTWARLLWHLDGRVDALPVRLLPLVAVVFEVWQNQAADIPNAVSAMVVSRCGLWLAELEAHLSSRLLPDGEGETSRWRALGDDAARLAGSLRRLLLRSARVEPDWVADYLARIAGAPEAARMPFEEILGFSRLLAETHPAALSDLTSARLLSELPEAKRARLRSEEEARFRRLAEARARAKGQATRQDELTLSSLGGLIGGDHVSSHDRESLALGRGDRGFFPPSPLHEPFRSLFASAPETALALVKRLTNHAVEAWRQYSRMERASRTTPVPIEVAFPWGKQAFWGGTREYLWSRGMWAPKPLASAYLALEAWAFRELGAGACADAIIERIVRGNDSIAALGTAVTVSLSAGVVSDVTAALAACQRLWQPDLWRLVQEPSIASSGMIGFRPSQREDLESVRAANALAARSLDIRQLAMLHMLQADRTKAEVMRRAISAFADHPPYETEEEMEDPETRAGYVSRARTNSGWGALENFHVVDLPEQPGAKAVAYRSPDLENEAVRERLSESRRFLEASALWRWADTSLLSGAPSPGMEVRDAVSAARALDREDLYVATRSDDGAIDPARSAVAGVAAVVISWARDSESDLGWARSVVARAAAMPEERHGLWSSVGIVSWHPCIFAARAFAAELRDAPADRAAAFALLTLFAHPLDCVSLEASRLAFGLWDVHPRLAWTGLRLSLELCGWQPGPPGSRGPAYDPAFDEAGRRGKVAVALACLDETAWAAPPVPRAEWIPPASPADDGAFDEDERQGSSRSAPPGWSRPASVWDSRRAGSVLAMVPVDAVVLDERTRPALLGYADAMLAWTIDAMVPPWSRMRGRHERDTQHLEWIDDLARTLGGVIGHLSFEEADERYLRPITALADEPCFDLLAPLADRFVAVHVMDPPAIAPCALAVMQAILSRLLEAPEFKAAGWRAGELHGFDMPSLVRSLLLVQVEEAPRAARFANGDWSGVGAVLPVVDRFVKAVGWSAPVMSEWLTLCERARAHFPADAFADAVLSVAVEYPEGPAGWRETLIAARIAALVQHLSERVAPLPNALGQKLLRILDFLVDQGDRRSAALQISPAFRDLRLR